MITTKLPTTNVGHERTRARFQTVCDYVVATSIIKWDGTRKELVRADDPKGFALKVAHFGLLGVTVGEQPTLARKN